VAGTRAEAGACGAATPALLSLVPHSPQNFTPGALAVPHDGHGAARLAPHSAQNFRPSSFGVEHAAQITVPPGSFGGTYSAANAGVAAVESRARRAGRKRGLAPPATIPDTRREVRVHEPTITEQVLRPSVVTTLVGVTLAAWLLVIVRMPGMDAGPGTDLGSAGWYLGIWVTMMAAMMLPSATPMVLLFSKVASGSTDRPGLATTLFVTGYLLVWAGYGLVAYGLFRLVRGLDPSYVAWEREGPIVAGGVIVLAGVYQFTPLKRICLRHCRTPLSFVMHHWHSGTFGALRMGIVHGAWCVGCCWALMVVLFAVGVMSITWMVILAAIVFAEKVLPVGERASRAVAVVLIAFGAWVAVNPGSVPGLTRPGTGTEMDSMLRHPWPSQAARGLAESPRGTVDT
jgi:predicted metal-binding membrane protein